jgi:hypothetical protein
MVGLAAPAQVSDVLLQPTGNLTFHHSCGVATLGWDHWASGHDPQAGTGLRFLSMATPGQPTVCVACHWHETDLHEPVLHLRFKP